MVEEATDEEEARRRRRRRDREEEESGRDRPERRKEEEEARAERKAAEEARRKRRRTRTRRPRDCRPIAGEITYGLERLALYIQGVDAVKDLDWNGQKGDKALTYGQVDFEAEKQFLRSPPSPPSLPRDSSIRRVVNSILVNRRNNTLMCVKIIMEHFNFLGPMDLLCGSVQQHTRPNG